MRWQPNPFIVNRPFAKLGIYTHRRQTTNAKHYTCGARSCTTRSCCSPAEVILGVLFRYRLPDTGLEFAVLQTKYWTEGREQLLALLQAYISKLRDVVDCQKAFLWPYSSALNRCSVILGKECCLRSVYTQDAWY